MAAQGRTHLSINQSIILFQVKTHKTQQTECRLLAPVRNENANEEDDILF